MRSEKADEVNDSSEVVGGKVYESIVVSEEAKIESTDPNSNVPSLSPPLTTEVKSEHSHEVKLKDSEILAGENEPEKAYIDPEHKDEHEPDDKNSNHSKNDLDNQLNEENKEPDPTNPTQGNNAKEKTMEWINSKIKKYTKDWNRQSALYSTAVASAVVATGFLVRKFINRRK
jgi:hypothetical protein